MDYITIIYHMIIAKEILLQKTILLQPVILKIRLLPTKG